MKQNLFDAVDVYEKFYNIEDLGKGRVLSPSDNHVCEFDFVPGDDKDYVLHLRGSSDLPKAWRSEPNYPVLYRRISESLVNDVLTANGNGEPVSRNIYYKLYSDEIGDAHEFDYEIDYVIDGAAQFSRTAVEVYYKGDGTRTVEDTDADSVTVIELEPTGGEWKNKSVRISADKQVDFIFIRVETESLDGELRLRAPRLFVGDDNILEPFEKQPLKLTTFRWVGENFSKIEWIPFSIELNGKSIFIGEKFERIFVNPSFEFEIPSGALVKGRNRLVINYSRLYADQHKFNLRAVKLVETDTRGVVAYDRAASAGEFPVLVKAKKGDEIRVKSDGLGNRDYDALTAESDGLYVVKLNIDKPFDRPFTAKISVGNKDSDVNIVRYIDKKDNIRVGTGDTIYIDINRRDIDRFLAWYFANGAGNMIVFRISYRWSGCMYTDKKLWDYMSKLFDDMNVSYSVMIDGRELPCAKTNSDGFSGGKLFDGYQSHEQDGAYQYWQSIETPRNEIFFNELCSRRLKKQGMLPKGSVVRRGDRYFKHYDAISPKNMQEANEQLIENFKIMTADSTRHTGPSVMFKYIAQAGIQWLGAELMYAPFDVVIAALRGASRAIGNDRYGAHIAIQWSTTPHDTVYRYRRYLYGLYNCYMNGIDNINTEEGLYRMEERFAELERDSAGCRNHFAVEREFYEYVRNHNRRGCQTVEIGILHGNYDPISVFGRGNVYGMQGADWRFGAPEKSWDILSKVFYKGAKLKQIYLHPCPKFNVGYFSKTPYGQVDIVPIESGADKLKRYKTLMMLGWNSADEKMIEDLTAFVENGGTLLLAAPHLYTTVDRLHGINHTSHILLNDATKRLLGITDIKRDNRVTLSTAKECGLRFRASNKEVTVNELGSGKVYFVNHFKYPSEIKTLYANIMEQLAKEISASNVYRGIVNTSGYVTTSTFDAEDRRVIYMLDVKWWRKNKKRETVTATIADVPYKFEIERDVLNQLNIFGKSAVLTYDNATDIIGIDNGILTAQGSGVRKVTILKDGASSEIILDFTECGRVTVKI